MTKNDRRKKAPDSGENQPPQTPPSAANPPLADKVGNGEHEDADDAPNVQSQPVTVAMLKTVLGEMSGAFESRIQQTEEMFDKKLNEQGAELQNAFKQWGDSLVQQINEKVHPQQAESAGGIDKDDIVQKIIDRGINKYFGEERESADPAVYEFKKNTDMLNRIIYKKAANLTGRIVDKALKQALKEGDLVDEEVGEVIRSNIGEHSPA